MKEARPRDVTKGQEGLEKERERGGCAVQKGLFERFVGLLSLNYDVKATRPAKPPFLPPFYS
jgi:hypothetical protein